MTTTPIPIQLTTRREFCAHACQAASMLAIGTMAGCSGGPTSPSAIPQLVSITVASVPALAIVGGSAVVQTSAGTFLITRTATDSFTALTSVCTHEGCTINSFSGGRFVCPCHGSEYSPSGAVVVGPATRALQQYATQFDNGVLTFTA